MAFPEKLLKFKFPILICVSFFVVIFSLLYFSPRFVDILAYFWPLLLSTALFLVAVVVFGRTSPSGADAPGENAVDGILDYVAGKPDLVPQSEVEEESYKSE